MVPIGHKCNIPATPGRAWRCLSSMHLVRTQPSAMRVLTPALSAHVVGSAVLIDKECNTCYTLLANVMTVSQDSSCMSFADVRHASSPDVLLGVSS